MCFVNGCSTPDWVPSDKAVSDKEREGGQEEVKSGRRSDRESHHRENRWVRKDEGSGAERGLRWRSETAGERVMPV